MPILYVSADVGGEPILSDDSFVVLEPEKWIGKRFPVAGDIDIGTRLLKGSWIVVLYDHNCSKCQEAMPKYVRQAERLRNDSMATKIALVELPPYRASVPSANGPCEHGRLSDAKEWFVTTPVEIRPRDGMVSATAFANERSLVLD